MFAIRSAQQKQMSLTELRRWHGEAVTEGLSADRSNWNNPSVSLTADSSLCTREPKPVIAAALKRHAKDSPFWGGDYFQKKLPHML
jgi:hypothetical protein